MTKLSGLQERDTRTPAQRSAAALERIAAAFERIATVAERYLDDAEAAPAPEDHPAVRRLSVFGEDDPPPPKGA